MEEYRKSIGRIRLCLILGALACLLTVALLTAAALTSDDTVLIVGLASLILPVAVSLAFLSTAAKVKKSEPGYWNLTVPPDLDERLAALSEEDGLKDVKVMRVRQANYYVIKGKPNHVRLGYSGLRFPSAFRSQVLILILECPPGEEGEHAFPVPTHLSYVITVYLEGGKAAVAKDPFRELFGHDGRLRTLKECLGFEMFNDSECER